MNKLSKFINKLYKILKVFFYSSVFFKQIFKPKTELLITIFAPLSFVSVLAVFILGLLLISVDLSTFPLPFCLLSFFVYPLLAVALNFYSLFFFKKPLPFNLHLHTLYICTNTAATVRHFGYVFLLCTFVFISGKTPFTKSPILTAITN